MSFADKIRNAVNRIEEVSQSCIEIPARGAHDAFGRLRLRHASNEIIGRFDEIERIAQDADEQRQKLEQERAEVAEQSVRLKQERTQLTQQLAVISTLTTSAPQTSEVEALRAEITRLQNEVAAEKARASAVQLQNMQLVEPEARSLRRNIDEIGPVSPTSVREGKRVMRTVFVRDSQPPFRSLDAVLNEPIPSIEDMQQELDHSSMKARNRVQATPVRDLVQGYDESAATQSASGSQQPRKPGRPSKIRVAETETSWSMVRWPYVGQRLVEARESWDINLQKYSVEEQQNTLRKAGDARKTECMEARLRRRPQNKAKKDYEQTEQCSLSKQTTHHCYWIKKLDPPETDETGHTYKYEAVARS